MFRIFSNVQNFQNLFRIFCHVQNFLVIFRHFSEYLAQKLVYSESLDFVVMYPSTCMLICFSEIHVAL